MLCSMFQSLPIWVLEHRCTLPKSNVAVILFIKPRVFVKICIMSNCNENYHVYIIYISSSFFETKKDFFNEYVESKTQEKINYNVVFSKIMAAALNRLEDYTHHCGCISAAINKERVIYNIHYAIMSYWYQLVYADVYWQFGREVSFILW